MLQKEVLGRAAQQPPVTLLGVPLALGCSVAGVELGPAVMRATGLKKGLARLGYAVEDGGDIGPAPELDEDTTDASDNVALKHGNAAAEGRETVPVKMRHLAEITQTCQALAERVAEVLGAGRMPIVLGGDHAIAIGSVSGIARHFRQTGEAWGLLWFDAHADMNTPETTPSGNIHGMPLASLLGYGTSGLTHLCGFAPKIVPEACVHIGARDVDEGERRLIKQLGMRFITMREVDERGMSACMDEALALIKSRAEKFAVTFDIDVLDPGDAPGSGTLVRGGLTYREAHLAMERIAEADGLSALEVVEINTVLDINNRTAQLGVELILSALGKTIL